MNGVRDVDAAGLSETLEARSHVYPVAIDLLALDHHVAEIDADAKLHAAFGRVVHIFRLERGLHFDGAIHRLDHAGKLGQHAVAGRINEAAVMLGNSGVEQVEMGREGAQGRLFVLAHEAAVAENVGG